ncbi:hypothetical protein JXA63_02180 [Candidatus Woesebacteria bacterium]|nr:hypothetical protein [Candidatus Woesebacteria bacterium]
MKRFIYFLLIPVILLFTTSVVRAQDTTPPDNKRTGDVITLMEDEVIDRDFFAAGDTVEIFGTVNGDVYAAGSNVIVNGVINGDLLAAGGVITIAGEISDDVRVAGGTVTVNADIGRNITVFGGNVDITENATIAGSVVSGAGNLFVSGPVAKDITVGAGSMSLSNIVGGDIVSGVGELRVSSQANLGGDLYYYSDQEASISQGASVSGVIQRNDPETRWRVNVDVDEEELREDAQGFLKGVTTVGKMISFSSLLIVGLLMTKLFPNYSQKVVTRLKESPWKSLGVGFLLLIAVPLAAIIAMITVVGIRISLIALALYSIFLYVSKVFVILWAGEFLMSKISKKNNAYGSFTLGLIAYFVVTLLPVIGGLIKFFTLLFSLGAMMITCKETYKKALESKIY